MLAVTNVDAAGSVFKMCLSTNDLPVPEKQIPRFAEFEEQGRRKGSKRLSLQEKNDHQIFRLDAILEIKTQ